MSSSEKQVPKKKFCCACSKEKEVKCFYVNRYSKDGYESRCKVCKKTKILCKKKLLSKRIPQYKNAPQLWNVSRQDWIDTYNFLEKIGYNLSSEKTIHEQFCENHNLPTRKRMYEKSIQYTPQELGMI